MKIPSDATHVDPMGLLLKSIGGLVYCYSQYSGVWVFHSDYPRLPDDWMIDKQLEIFTYGDS